MSLQVTPGVASLALSWDLPKGSYAAIVKWQLHGTDTWTASVPVVAAAQMNNLPAQPIDIQVVLVPSPSDLSITGPIYTATATPLEPGAPPVPVTPPIITAE